MTTHELVQLVFDKIVQTRTYTMIILIGGGKRFAIYVDPNVGRLLQTYLIGAHRPRPLTHDLIDMMLKGLDVRMTQVVINDLQDTIYFARLYMEQYQGSIRHIVELDVRPSDGMTLVLLSNIPFYCTRDVLERAVAMEEW